MSVGETGEVQQPRRRRRRPEEAEDEILSAAKAFLSERPFREMTVDSLMAEIELSRPSFYVYFRDRHHVVMKLIEEIGGELFSRADAWFGGDGEDPAAETYAAVDGVAEVYERQGKVLRAIAHAATQDEEVEEVYIGGLIGGFIDAVEAQIKIEVERGNAVPMDDPRRTAEAAVWMHERMLSESFGKEPVDGREPVVRVLAEALLRTVFGRTS
jgi:AcrR family transcriptional regulator